MKNWRIMLASAALLAVACGTATWEGGEGAADDLAVTEQGLELKVKELFGPDARVGRVFGRGEAVVVGVALEAAPEESDVPEPLALARLDRGAGALSVLDQAPAFREARLLGEELATVSTEGALALRRADGAEVALAAGVKGDLAAAPNGAVLFTAEDAALGAGETKVVLAGREGLLELVADGEGVDDRASLSPDGQTVVFVSGRTGVAALYRTTLGGGAAVQLTNVGLETAAAEVSEEASAEEVAPAGFVPPPVTADALTWVSAEVVRYDAGGGEWWRVDVRSGAATREGGAR